ncbi:MAG: hypothetical protein LUE22_04965 [Oscillospiraceae bacterium]|nr:hypothetical protein [Oscillospiraceae bacterium]
MKIPKAQKRTSGIWFIQLRLDGRSITVTAETEAKVQAKALAIKSGIVGPEGMPGKKTLGRMLDEYIDARSNVLSLSTIRGYKTIR